VTSKLITVTAVEPKGAYRLLVTFDDGAVKEIELGDLLADAHGVFLPLRDPKVFAQVKANLETGTIEWPGEVDLDPEVLYGRHEPASGKRIIRRTVREPDAAIR
jgi:hypothetical protein